MKLSQAFDKTLRDFGINAKWLSERSGVSEKMISLFRNDKQRIYSDSLEKLLEALPGDARRYFFDLIRGGQTVYPHFTGGRVIDLIEQMEPVELAELLNAVADKLVRQKEKVAV